jgi:hypothetical protein
MGAQKRFIDATRVDDADDSGTHGATETPFREEIGPVTQDMERKDAEVCAVGTEGANGLMADYLAECENLFALLTKMAQNGQLDRQGLASRALSD